mmetsp:Transcript_44010/g.99064  ORF Transcript_44010/g.99064 Transcript_44010/m.99064 type:complete len:99 (-) Transcript_44010:285-581(-)|eukprot:CAMPEP_0194575704 /NCGR_PEP_ID=MMETSP0292-20121207/11090_1 /TAXON_ID=39354 /ORGANISM="Heterosigma akashiwo, Strain CCMP2393" /LENGTH=98 /DNA_ID=CAMNT_0039427561 /DNA_START=36 /DNA_END=332 /DNA_ORIENTATION=-
MNSLIARTNLSSRGVFKTVVTRAFSEAAAAQPAAKSGGGFFQRLSSFLVGVGVGGLAGGYYLFEEVQKSNKELEDVLKQCIASNNQLEKRVGAMEKKM